MKKNKQNFVIVTAFLLMSMSACARANGQSNLPVSNEISGKVIITFDYKRQSGSASNQFAIWIEDMNGNYINTIYATPFTARGGYSFRPDSLALWVKKSNLASIAESKVDAISSATPRAGKLSYEWDLTDTKGNIVPIGDYKFFIEGALRWKNSVLYSGVITIGSTPITVQADSEYHYEASDIKAEYWVSAYTQPALTNDSPENAMISSVMANFVPLKNN